MPAKIWSRTPAGEIQLTVETRGRTSGRPEDFALAEDLDAAIDRALDDAEALRARLARKDVPAKFTKNWAVGRALADSNVLKHPALHNESPALLYRAMAAKFRVLARADGSQASNWVQLRPVLSDDPTNREGSSEGRHDHWSMCVWLAEQDYDDAVLTFGGSTRNVWQMLERKALSPLVMRQALRSWLASFPPDVAADITSAKKFPELMKALRQRWPARGRRPALQPVHYSEGDLRAEIARVAENAGLTNTSRA